MTLSAENAQDLLTASVAKMLATDQKYVSSEWQKREKKRIKTEVSPSFPLFPDVPSRASMTSPRPKTRP